MGVFDFFKSKRKVGALLFRDDRVIKRYSLPVEDRYMVDEKNSRAWGLHSGLLTFYSGKPHHILIEHSCAPIGLNEERWDPELDGIVDEQYGKKMMKLKKESIREKSVSLMLMMGLLLTTAVVILVLAGLMKSGGFHLPSLPSFW